MPIVYIYPHPIHRPRVRGHSEEFVAKFFIGYNFKYVILIYMERKMYATTADHAEEWIKDRLRVRVRRRQLIKRMSLGGGALVGLLALSWAGSEVGKRTLAQAIQQTENHTANLPDKQTSQESPKDK